MARPKKQNTVQDARAPEPQTEIDFSILTEPEDMEHKDTNPDATKPNDTETGDAAPEGTGTPDPVTSEDQGQNLVRKKDIYDHVTVTTGLRKREVREAVDATLAYLYDQLSAGHDVQAPPLGKIRVVVKGEAPTARRTYRLNLAKPAEDKKDASAQQEALEDTAD